MLCLFVQVGGLLTLTVSLVSHCRVVFVCAGWWFVDLDSELGQSLSCCVCLCRLVVC